GLTVFLHDLLQDVAIQREVGHQALELAVLLAQLPRLAQPKPRVLLLPDVKPGLADPVLATDVAHLRPRFRLAQRPQNPLLTAALLRHSHALLILLQRTIPGVRFSTYRRHIFWPLGQPNPRYRTAASCFASYELTCHHEGGPNLASLTPAGLVRSNRIMHAARTGGELSMPTASSGLRYPLNKASKTRTMIAVAAGSQRLSASTFQSELVRSRVHQLAHLVDLRHLSRRRHPPIFSGTRQEWPTDNFETARHTHHESGAFRATACAKQSANRPSPTWRADFSFR